MNDYHLTFIFRQDNRFIQIDGGFQHITLSGKVRKVLDAQSDQGNTQHQQNDLTNVLHDSSLPYMAPLRIMHSSEQCSASISMAFSSAAMEGVPKWAFQIPSWAR